MTKIIMKLLNRIRNRYHQRFNSAKEVAKLRQQVKKLSHEALTLQEECQTLDEQTNDLLSKEAARDAEKEELEHRYNTIIQSYESVLKTKNDYLDKV